MCREFGRNNEILTAVCIDRIMGAAHGMMDTAWVKFVVVLSLYL
jgi:hypothetical protein